MKVSTILINTNLVQALVRMHLTTCFRVCATAHCLRRPIANCQVLTRDKLRVPADVRLPCAVMIANVILATKENIRVSHTSQHTLMTKPRIGTTVQMMR